MVVEDRDATEPLTLLQWDEIRGVSAVPPHWPMVAIRDHQKHDHKNPPIVFPPNDHENLLISPELLPSHYRIHNIHAGDCQISLSDSESDSELNSSSTFSPSDSSTPPRSPVYSALRARPAAGRLGSWTEILSSKVNGLLRLLCGALTSSRGAMLTFRSAAFAAVLIAFLCLRRRRRLTGGEVSRYQLLSTIKQRDEKINQLLDQISRMNQMMHAVQKQSNS